jgi:mono/diheme cytochrome c family protein
MIRKLVYLFIFVLVISGVISLFAYDVIKIDWVTFMEIQPSYRAMENPLPVPADSIPIEGAAYTIGAGVQTNPVIPDEVSIQRGAELYRINCLLCHGKQGKGDGVIGTYFTYKPADLTSVYMQQLSDEAVFYTISTGVEGRMPPLNENLSVRERWDLVNFLSLLSQASAPTPAP